MSVNQKGQRMQCDIILTQIYFLVKILCLNCYQFVVQLYRKQALYSHRVNYAYRNHSDFVLCKIKIKTILKVYLHFILEHII